MDHAISTILQTAVMEPCQPWPRYVLTREQWLDLIAHLARAPLPMLAAWADTTHVHALFHDAAAETMVPLSVPVEGGPVEGGIYPALSAVSPAAAWYERMIHDLFGYTAEGGTDARAWLDHGRWALTQPLNPRPGPPHRDPEPPEFQEVAGTDLMQRPVGPLASGIGEAAHLRLTVHGGRIHRAESRLGYTHKGALGLMLGKSARTAARFAARLSGDATVAHAAAFALAAESALGAQAPPRAAALRKLMAALERIATHLDDLASVGHCVGSAAVHGRCGLHQEQLRRAMATAFGHRLMMDCVIPGGVAGDIVDDGIAALRLALSNLTRELPALRRLHESNFVAARLSGTGKTARALVEALAVGGVVARAAARGHAGDALARTHARLDAIATNLELAEDLLDGLPDGAVMVAPPMTSGEGLGRGVSARGDVWHWLRLDHGQVVAVFPRDPGWALWPLAEAALRGAPVTDAALICLSLGLPASGMDL
jgi:Ni,Fe-hydrogenase III large subunit